MSAIESSARPQESPKAARKLAATGDYELMGKTDCDHECEVEPDGVCSHGWESAGLTLGVV